jgi:hypothetical protein
VAGALDHLEPRDAIRQCVHGLAGGGVWNYGVECAHADQRRAVDAGELVEDVEPAHQLETRGIQVRVDDRARLLLLTGDPGAEQGPAAGPLLIGHRRVIVAVGAFHDRGHLVAPGLAEGLDDPTQVEPSPCGLQHH